MINYNFTKIQSLSNVNFDTNASNLTKIMSMIKAN